MRSFIAASLFFVTLLMSGFVYADYQPGFASGSYSGQYSTGNNGQLVFAGPKLGWMQIPETSSVCPTIR